MPASSSHFPVTDKAKQRWVALICKRCGGISDGPIDERNEVCTCSDENEAHYEPQAVCPVPELEEVEREREELRKRLGRAEELLGEYGAGGTPAGVIGGIHNLAHIGEAAQRNFESAKKRADRAEQQAASMREEVEQLRGLLQRVTTYPKRSHPGRPCVSYMHLNADIEDEIAAALSQSPTDVEDACTCSQYLLPDDCPAHGRAQQHVEQPEQGNEVKAGQQGGKDSGARARVGASLASPVLSDEEREKLRAERQHWLDEDVKNGDYIERLEERQNTLESALLPFIDAKPMPGGEDDHYRLSVSGDALRAAKEAYDSSALASREYREKLRERLRLEALKLFTEALPRGVHRDSASEHAVRYVDRLFDAVFPVPSDSQRDQEARNG